MRAAVLNIPCRSKAAKVLWTEEEEMEVTRLAEQYELDGPQEGTPKLPNFLSGCKSLALTSFVQQYLVA